MKESLAAVLPVTLVVLFLCFVFLPIPVGIVPLFLGGAALLVIGMGLFTLGTEMSLIPIGTRMGTVLTRSRSLWLILPVMFLIGTLVTVAEPDLTVLAGQVPDIPNLVLILSVAVGTGFFLLIAVLRIFTRIPFAALILICYLALFVLSFFVPRRFFAVAFDSGGVTTGPMTVPLLMSLGTGVFAIRSDKDAENDSFGLIALSSVGPVLAVMLLAFFFNVTGSEYTVTEIVWAEDTLTLRDMFLSRLPEYFIEVGKTFLPLLGLIAVFWYGMKFRGSDAGKVLIGLIYTYVGLAVFLCGANVGFMPMANFLGEAIGESELKWIAVPVGMVLGWVTVAAEPAVAVLTEQVFEMTAGAVSKKQMNIALSVGVSLSVGIAMLRSLTGIPLIPFLLGGYSVALLLALVVSPVFTAIAFDSGGVASGPMTATFLLPLTVGVCAACGGNITEDAFGLVSMVAMTPPVTIQIMGLVGRLRSSGKLPSVKPFPTDGDITLIELVSYQTAAAGEEGNL